MKIDRQALCEIFFREWEISTTPSDLPGEIKELLDCVDYELEGVEGYFNLCFEWRQAISEETFKHITTDKDYEKDLKDLTYLFRNLLANGYTTDQIDQLINDAKGEV